MKTIERLRELEKAATPGPWTHDGMGEVSGAGGVVVAQVMNPEDFPCRDETEEVATGEFVANVKMLMLRNALPALLAEIAAWRESYEDGTVRLRGSNYGYSTATDEADFVPVQDAMSRTDEAIRKLDEVTP